MRKRYPPAGLRLLGALAVLSLAAGCRTPRSAAVPAAPAEPSAEALARYADGLVHEYGGRPAEALKSYRLAIELDPNRSAPYARALAAHVALVRAGRESPLPEALARFAEAYPHSAEPMRWLARLHRAEGRTDEALAAFEAGLRRSPDDGELHAERLALLVRDDRTAEALEALRAAIRREVSPRALAPTAGELLKRGREAGDADAESGALAVLDTLRSRAGADAELLLLLAELYRRGGAGDRAKATLAAAREAAPERPEVYLQTALTAFAREDFAQARRVLAEGVAVVDRPLDLLRLLAEAATQDALRLEPAAPEAAAEAREEAIDAVRRLLESVPREAALRLRLADLLILSERFDDAIAELARVEPDQEELRAQIAHRFLAAGAPGDAIAQLQALADERPDDVQLQSVLGEMLEQAGRRGEAIEAFARAAAAPEAGPLPHARYAALLAEENRMEEALAAVDAGLEAAGEQALLVETGALLRLEMGRFEEALAWLGRLRALRAPGEEGELPPRFLAHRALALQYLGETAEAAELLAAAMAGDELAVEAYVYRAARLDRADETGGRAAATRTVLEALARALSDEPLVLLYAGLYEHQAEAYAAAVEIFARAVRVAEEHPHRADRLTPQFYFVYGAAAERAGRYEQAMELLARCIELDPDHALALNYLAYIWAERGMNLDQALVYVRRALEQEPESGAFIDTLGWIYFQQGRFDEALVELKRALEFEPEEPTILDHVGDALHALNRTEEAIPYWLRSLEHGPENPEAVRAKLREAGVEPPEEEDAAAEPEPPEEEAPAEPEPPAASDAEPPEAP